MPEATGINPSATGSHSHDERNDGGLLADFGDGTRFDTTFLPTVDSQIDEKRYPLNARHAKRLRDLGSLGLPCPLSFVLSFARTLSEAPSLLDLGLPWALLGIARARSESPRPKGDARGTSR